MFYEILKELKQSLEREISDISKITNKNMNCKQSEIIADLISAYNNIRKICNDYEKTEKEFNPIPMTLDVAKKWVSNMKNSDGTTGEHWTIEQTTQVKNKEGLKNISDALFYAVMNMIYSDYSEIFKEYGINTVDFYTKMAKSWIMDIDSNPEKTSLYYYYIFDK